MQIIIREYKEKDLPEMIRIWNEVVEDGVAFPQEECLNDSNFAHRFSLCTLKIQYLAVIQLSKSSCYAA